MQLKLRSVIRVCVRERDGEIYLMLGLFRGKIGPKQLRNLSLDVLFVQLKLRSIIRACVLDGEIYLMMGLLKVNIGPKQLCNLSLDVLFASVCVCARYT